MPRAGTFESGAGGACSADEGSDGRARIRRCNRQQGDQRSGLAESGQVCVCARAPEQTRACHCLGWKMQLGMEKLGMERQSRLARPLPFPPSHFPFPFCHLPQHLLSSHSYSEAFEWTRAMKGRNHPLHTSRALAKAQARRPPALPPRPPYPAPLPPPSLHARTHARTHDARTHAEIFSGRGAVMCCTHATLLSVNCKAT